MDNEYLVILDSAEQEVMRVYTYDFTSELMGKENLTIEIDIPIQYSNNIEVAYPFSTAWHIEYNNNIYYLNTDKPTGVKNNEKMTIHYTLVFESVGNRLDSIFIKPYARVFTDMDEDGYADETETISDIVFVNESGFYGNIYEFAQYIRKNLAYTFDYIKNTSGNNILIEYTDTTGTTHNYVIPQYTILLNNIDYDIQTNNGNKIFVPNEDVLREIEYLDTLSSNPKYKVSDRQNIETTYQTFFATLQKMNEVFTRIQNINGINKEVGYTFSFEKRTIDSEYTSDNKNHSVYCIIINPRQENVIDSNGQDVVFEYGGLTDKGGLLSITRTHNETKAPTRVYGTGGNENLPINYFHIYEDRTNEVAKINGKEIASLSELVSYFSQHPDEIDKNKTYLVPNKDFPFVWDKYIYSDSLVSMAGADFSLDSTMIVAQTTVIIVSEVNTEEYSFKTNNVWREMEGNYIYLVKEESNYLGYWYDVVENDIIELGIWSSNNLGNEFDSSTGLPIISTDFLENGTLTNLTNSDTLTIVNSDKNLPNTLIEDRIYYVIYKLDDGTTSYHGSFYRGIQKEQWVAIGESTYERVQPFPKYITSFPNLMPECFRAYVAGWRYGYWYGQLYNNTDTDVSKNYVPITVNSLPANINSKNVIYIVYLYGFPCAYMPIFINNQFREWRFIGLLEINATNEFYNRDVFEQGLKDYCIGIVKNQNTYSYLQCGKIFKPITYYENTKQIEKYGIIETKQDFTDIKPSLVAQYINGLGRLDELVDVYIPNIDDNDKEKWGKYWLDEDNIIEDTQTGIIYNSKLPELPIPEKETIKTFTYQVVQASPTKCEYGVQGDNPLWEHTEDIDLTAIDFTKYAGKTMCFEISSTDLPDIKEFIDLDGLVLDF